MILYFSDRHLNILGQASTNLPGGIRVIDDLKTEDVETGVSIFECKIPFDKNTRSKVEEWAEVGNFVLRSSENENEFYNIIDVEIDTKKQTVYIYAEDDGLDLLNEVVGAYEADQYYPISDYIERFAAGAGWEVGINEVEGLTRKLSWDSEQTASARLLSVAEAFNNCELSYSFEIKGLQISKKYINIFEKRGRDTGIQLRLNKEIDSIVTTKSVANLATALKATGGTPDDSEQPITLLGYEYDDGDFYVDGYVLKSRKALEKWSRYLWKDDESQQSGGHIVKQFSFDTTSQAVLCEKTIEELKSVCDMEVNYEVDISKLPENVKIGDRVNIIDDAGNLYLSSRVLILETSVSDQTRRAVLGEHLIKKDGISSKVEKLAAQFAKSTVSVANAKAIAANAKALAEQAQTQADAAMTEAEAAQAVADEAKTVADAATQSAANAQAQAQAAEAAVNKVEESVTSIEKTVTEAKNAADNAQQAATTATEKAEEAKTAADNAVQDATEAKTAAGNAQTAADGAVSNASAAVETANAAKSEAEAASTTAAAAKLDAEQAVKDIDDLGKDLETTKTTMSTDYARKTELTEATANLQTQITQNSAEIRSTASKLVTIDETANNAASLASQAKSEAASAQSKANQATADAEAAQTAADNAAQAAADAQFEADTAKAAADTAKSVADKAEADLAAAKADLATVQDRVDATEEDITAAQQAVETAQAAADKAKADAATAASKAETAQTTANTAVTNAEAAQTAADNAASQAAIAQAAANEAKGNAAAAQAKADAAAQAAADAQNTADTAAANASAAQTKANEAATAAANAQKAADDADAKAQQAATDLETAQQNLIDVSSRVDATKEEVAAAQAAVETAQAAANKAKADAEAAQATADTAKANAATAQLAADTAKNAADAAQAAADDAQAAADKAQEDVDALAVRVTDAETTISQNAEAIRLAATKTEVAETLGGYYTKEESDAEIELTAEGVKMTVSSQITDVENLIKFDGRNLLTGTSTPKVIDSDYVSYIPTVMPLDTETPYTLSGDITINAGDISQITVKFIGEDTSVTYPEKVADIIDGRLDVTFEEVTGKEEQLLIYAGVEGNTSGNNLTVSNLKLEKGNMSTAWSDSPEDENIKGRLAAAESMINQLSNMIKMLVRDKNGTSQMTQTGEDVTWSFNTGEIDEAISKNSTDITDIKSKQSTTEDNVSNLEKWREKFDEHVKLTTYEDEPCIMLFEEDSNYKRIITNTRIICIETTEDGDKVLSISDRNKSKYDEIEIGGCVIKKRTNGNIAFAPKGE